MEKYELIVIVDASLPAEEKEMVVKEVCEAVTKCDGKVINSKVWIDKHKFPFLMKKRPEGTYYIVNLEAAAASLKNIRQILKRNERVLRSLIVKEE